MIEPISEIAEFVSQFHFKVQEHEKSVAFRAPCLGTNLIAEELEDGWYAVWFMCRTLSNDWPGERSDLNDITSSMMAALLGFYGQMSLKLFDYNNEFSQIESELYRRAIIPMQPPNLSYRMTPDSIGSLLRVFFWVTQQFHYALPGYCPHDWREVAEAPVSYRSPELLTWARKISEPTPIFELGSCSYSLRTNPRLFYCRSEEAASVARDKKLADVVKIIAADKKRSQVPGIGGNLLVRGRVRNFIPKSMEDQARSIISAVEGKSNVAVVPFENCAVFAGTEHVVLLSGECGRDQFMVERERLFDRRHVEDAVLLPRSSYYWHAKPDGQRFEDLARDLLASEPFVTWVRSTGPARERDGGKDMIARIKVGADRNVRLTERGGNYREKTVVIQCKATNSTVGTGDVREIRDVIEDSGAEGYILITSAQRISSALIQRLNTIEERNGYYTDWWDRKHLEELLSRNQHVLKKYSDIVTAQSEDE